jgi:hypothetical protein
MQVYDVNNLSDTQSNEYLTNHHLMGVKHLYDKPALHNARLGKIADRDATGLKNNMSISRLTHFRVERFFIKKMRPFSECEDPTFREQVECE